MSPADYAATLTAAPYTKPTAPTTKSSSTDQASLKKVT